VLQTSLLAASIEEPSRSGEITKAAINLPNAHRSDKAFLISKESDNDKFLANPDLRLLRAPDQSFS
jgi:hypothetical protein